MLQTNDSFKEKVLKGLEESEFSEIGFKKNPFLPFIPKGKEAISKFVNRKKETTLLVRYLPELFNGFISLLVLSGSKGIGKTHFLLYIYNELSDMEEETGHEIKLINKDNFKELYNKYKTGELTKPQVILTDDTEKIWDKFREEFAEMVDGENNIKFISAWKSSNWNQIKQDNVYSSIKPACIKMNKLSDEDLIQIINTRIRDSLISKQSPFSDSSLLLMANFSEGIPYSMVYFCEKLIHFALDNNLKEIGEESTRNFIEELNIKKFDITSFTPSQLKVLKVLINITNSKKRGATSSEVADELELGRTGALRHLKVLLDKNILDEKLEDKRRFYFVKPCLIGQIESSLLEGGID